MTLTSTEALNSRVTEAEQSPKSNKRRRKKLRNSRRSEEKENSMPESYREVQENYRKAIGPLKNRKQRRSHP